MTLPQEEDVCVSFWGLESRCEVGGRQDPCGASKAQETSTQQRRRGGVGRRLNFIYNTEINIKSKTRIFLTKTFCCF